MLPFVLVGAALAEAPRAVDAGSFGRVGERVGAAEIVAVQTHPEFERVTLRAADGELVAEIVGARAGSEGLCTAAGRTLFPRPELVVGPVGRIDLTPLCERLGRAEATVRVGGVELAVPAAADPAVWLRPGLVAAALAAVAAALVAVRGRVGLVVGAALAGLAVRAALTTPALFDGGSAGYEKLRVALGLARTEAWGPGYALWMRPAVELLGAVPAAVFATNLGFAAAWVGLVAWAGDLAGGRRVGWAAAAVAALLPAHTMISWSEAMHVSGTAWAMLALVGALELRAGRAPGAAMLVGGALAAVATRPDLGVLAAVVPFWLWGSPRRALAVGASAAVLGGAALAAQGGAGALVHPIDPLAVAALLLPRFGDPAPASGYFVWGHAGFTPAAWWALALLGLWRAPPGSALRGPALALAGLGALPFVFKVDPLPDAVRLQLVAQAGFGLLVAAGVVRAGWLGVVLLVGGLVAGPSLGGPRWRHREEWRFLAAEVPKLPFDAVVARAAGDRGEAFREAMQALGPARWTAGDGVTLLYRAPGDPPPGGAAWAEAEVGGWDVDARTAPPAGTAGFYALPPR